MLSILIPTYNYNVFPLASMLCEQAVAANISFEIICLDDGSSTETNTENETINTLQNASFEALQQNIGRSAIRNLLANKATKKWLLFLDADVLPVHDSFIRKYVEQAQKATVFCGGIRYKESLDHLSFLRYKYGKKHEEKSLLTRVENPNKYFFTANFLIEKDVFQTVSFNESLVQYGYEDLLFSKALNGTNRQVCQIENPVFHCGIDTNLEFVKKTKQALENLSLLRKQQFVGGKDTRILYWHDRFARSGLLFVARLLASFAEKKAIVTGSLWWFQLFRLGYLAKVVKNQG